MLFIHGLKFVFDKLTYYYNPFALIIAVFVPLVVLRITLRHQEKSTQRQLDEQRREFQLNLEQSEAQHEQALLIQSESARIARMPYFNFHGSVVVEQRNGCYTFGVTLDNKGNGTAVDVNLLFQEKEQGCILYVQDYNRQRITYRQTAPCSNNIARSGDQISFEILQDTSEAKVTKAIPGEVFFYIAFKDMMCQKYKQGCYLLFGDVFSEKREVEVCRAETYMPELIPE